MLICGDGAYLRVQPATAEQTSRQQITGITECSLYRPPNGHPWLDWCWCRCSNSWVATKQVPRDLTVSFGCKVSHARRRLGNYSELVRFDRFAIRPFKNVDLNLMILIYLRWNPFNTKSVNTKSLITRSDMHAVHKWLCDGRSTPMVDSTQQSDVMWSLIPGDIINNFIFAGYHSGTI